MAKESACNIGDTGDMGSIHRSGRSPEVGNGNTLQYSCLENSMGRGAWSSPEPAVAESDTTEWLSTHFYWSGVNKVDTSKSSLTD